MVIGKHVPVPLASGAVHSSARCSQISDNCVSAASRRRTKSTVCWFVNTSQIPSHAIIKNSSPSVSVFVVTSGYAVTICGWGPRKGSVLSGTKCHVLGVYWTMYGQTVRVIGLNSHQLRDKTVRMWCV